MSAPRVFICPHCKKRFASISAMNMHVRAMSKNSDHRPKPIVKQRRPWWKAVLKRLFGGR